MPRGQVALLSPDSLQGKERGTHLQRGPSPAQEFGVSHSLSQQSRRQGLWVPHFAGEETGSEGVRLRKSSRSPREGRGGIAIQVHLIQSYHTTLTLRTSGPANRKPCV